MTRCCSRSLHADYFTATLPRPPLPTALSLSTDLSVCAGALWHGRVGHPSRSWPGATSYTVSSTAAGLALTPLPRPQRDSSLQARPTLRAQSPWRPSARKEQIVRCTLRQMQACAIPLDGVLLVVFLLRAPQHNSLPSNTTCVERWRHAKCSDFLAMTCQRGFSSSCIPQCIDPRIRAFPITCNAGAVWSADPCPEVGTACGGVAVLSNRSPRCTNTPHPVLGTAGYCNVTCTDGSNAIAVCDAGADDWRFLIVSQTGIRQGLLVGE